tara:strand:+ start:165 stop:413 length:249 start_codon:yes stop_codon:yes gene_type:complete
MDYKFLDKVVGQLVRETTIDYDEERFLPPFSIPSSWFSPFLSHFSPHPSFIIHCREVYGLNKEETGYVWDKYILLIKDKLPY